MKPTEELLSTAGAAEFLGVKPTTIYTYVSRGKLQPVNKAGETGSWFRRSDLSLLTRRGRHLRTGSTMEETSISLIRNGTYWYRGVAPSALLGTNTFEQVAEFLWTGRSPAEPSWDVSGHTTSTSSTLGSLVADTALPLDRLRVAVSTMAAQDRLRYGTHTAGVMRSAQVILTQLVLALPLQQADRPEGRLAERLWVRLTPASLAPAAVSALEGALILMADHGLAPSTRAARMAASFRADVYGVIEAGLSILAGAWHGGRALSAEKMLDDIAEAGQAEGVVGALLRSGDIPCLGMPRYQDGDPRYRHLMTLLRDVDAGHPIIDYVDQIEAIVFRTGLPHPSVEIALAALSRMFGCVDGASEAIFAIGRSAGWVAHALEMYSLPLELPPSGSYVGLDPER